MSIFHGTTWFRANLTPYLKIIKNEIASVSGGGSSYDPIIGSVSPAEAPINVPTVVTILGDFFTPDSTFADTGVVYTNFVFISQHEVQITVESATDVPSTLTISNPAGSASTAFEYNATTWVDCRTGGSTFTMISRSGSNTTYNVQADGTHFSNIQLWAKSINVNSHPWARSANKKLSYIIKRPTSAMMSGLSSTGINPSSAQYYQAEQLFYSPSTYAWGFYGNTGTPGSGASRSITNAQFGSHEHIKFVYLDTGNSAAAYEVWGLDADTDDWDTGGTLISSGTVTAMGCDEPTLELGLIPNASTVLVAFNIE